MTMLTSFNSTTSHQVSLGSAHLIVKVHCWLCGALFIFMVHYDQW